MDRLPVTASGCQVVAKQFMSAWNPDKFNVVICNLRLLVQLSNIIGDICSNCEFHMVVPRGECKFSDIHILKSQRYLKIMNYNKLILTWYVSWHGSMWRRVVCEMQHQVYLRPKFPSVHMWPISYASYSRIYLSVRGLARKWIVQFLRSELLEARFRLDMAIFVLDDITMIILNEWADGNSGCFSLANDLI